VTSSAIRPLKRPIAPVSDRDFVSPGVAVSVDGMHGVVAALPFVTPDL
jgi:hypothetical protein